MKITMMKLEDAALAWASGKTVEVEGFAAGVGWQRILRLGEASKKDPSENVWTAFIFYDAAVSRLEGRERRFRVIEASTTAGTPSDAPTA